MIPLVLVHGFMGGSAQWGAQINALSSEHKVIAVDLPGFGENADLPVKNTIAGFCALGHRRTASVGCQKVQSAWAFDGWHDCSGNDAP